MILLDTDIASAFAKAGQFDILLQCFSSKLCICKSVYEELQIPISYGYKFPEIVFKQSEILFPNDAEEKLYLQFRNQYEIDRGESESIAIAKLRQIPFASFDRLALDAANKENCIIIPPSAVFIKIFLSTSLEKTLQIISAIEHADHRNMKNIREQLEVFNSGK